MTEVVVGQTFSLRAGFQPPPADPTRNGASFSGWLFA
jgi:hypothetical protein